MTADELILHLGLEPHPVEGGYFRETLRSPLPVATAGGPRSVGTAIYYLLTGTAVSEMHRLPGDEVFHFYLGDTPDMLRLHPDGTVTTPALGTALAAGEVPQLVVPGGVWQGSVRRAGPHGFTLVGATMAPGFDYADYVTDSRALRRGRPSGSWGSSKLSASAG